MSCEKCEPAAGIENRLLPTEASGPKVVVMANRAGALIAEVAADWLSHFGLHVLARGSWRVVVRGRACGLAGGETLST